MLITVLTLSISENLKNFQVRIRSSAVIASDWQFYGLMAVQICLFVVLKIIIVALRLQRKILFLLHVIVEELRIDFLLEETVGLSKSHFCFSSMLDKLRAIV